MYTYTKLHNTITYTHGSSMAHRDSLGGSLQNMIALPTSTLELYILHAYLSIYLYIYLSIDISIYIYIYIVLYIYIYICIYTYIYIYIYTSVYGAEDIIQGI